MRAILKEPAGAVTERRPAPRASGGFFGVIPGLLGSHFLVLGLGRGLGCLGGRCRGRFRRWRSCGSHRCRGRCCGRGLRKSTCSEQTSHQDSEEVFHKGHFLDALSGERFANRREAFPSAAAPIDALTGKPAKWGALDQKIVNLRINISYCDISLQKSQIGLLQISTMGRFDHCCRRGHPPVVFFSPFLK